MSETPDGSKTPAWPAAEPKLDSSAAAGAAPTSDAECSVCGRPGRNLYSGLRDGLFEAPGRWGVRECPVCGLLELQPKPLDAERAAHYKTYFTHGKPAAAAAAEAVTGRLAGAVLARAWSYASLDPGGPASAAGGLLARVPSIRRAAGRRVLWLEARPGGRLLDVGCGNGAFLRRMRALGWDVRGLDADPAAVRAARGSGGFDVACGTLADADLPPAAFAAITLHHVIEHLPRPDEDLGRCAGALAPGGRIVVVTPNGAALGRRVFGPAWRGLEIPRHLQVFTPRSLRLLLEAAGFAIERLDTRADIAPWVLAESLRLRRRRRGRIGGTAGPAVKAAGRLFQAGERSLLLLGLGVGEEIVAVARRPD